MAKTDRNKKARPAAGSPAVAFSPEAQEIRALLRRIPDGFQAALQALADRSPADRERVMAELARGLGREILPLVRAAALARKPDLAQTAIRVLPVFGTRAAGDVVVEVAKTTQDEDSRRLAWEAAQAFQARGVNVVVPEPERSVEPRLVLREMWTSAPDGAGSRSLAARFQDPYGVWHAILVLWNDEVGIKDAFMRPISRQDWEERVMEKRARGLTYVLCPPDFGRWQFQQALAIGCAGGDAARHVPKWQELVGPPPEGYAPEDPLALLEGKHPDDLAALVTDSQDLFEHTEARVWFLEAETCLPWLGKWRDVQVLARRRGRSEDAADDLLDTVREAAEALLTPDLVRLYRGRLVDLARVLSWEREHGWAVRAAAAAATVETQPVGTHPFFTALLQRSLRATEALLLTGRLGRGARVYRR